VNQLLEDESNGIIGEELQFQICGHLNFLFE
jgi:hypothetical protein